MKAHLINTHLLVPRSRSSAKVKVKYKGYISQKMAISGAIVFHKNIVLILYLRAIETLVCRREIILGALHLVLHKIRYTIFKIWY